MIWSTSKYWRVIFHMGTPKHKEVLWGEKLKINMDNASNIEVLKSNHKQMELINFIDYISGLTFHFSEKMEGVILKY
jgi:hypothetical protein